MRTLQANKAIATILVGAMGIDGSLSKEERERVAKVLTAMGEVELLPEVGLALDNDFGDFDLFRECKNLLQTPISQSQEEVQKVFKLVASVISTDRFVSQDEASFLSALSRCLKIAPDRAKKILQEVLAARKGRIEISGDNVDALLHPHLKELLSFSGAEDIVGEAPKNSFEEGFYSASSDLSSGQYSEENIRKALGLLGLNSFSTPEEAEEAWLEIINSTDIKVLAKQGIDYLISTLSALTKASEAYKLIKQYSELRANTTISKSKMEIEIKDTEAKSEGTVQKQEVEDAIKEVFTS